MEPIRQSSKQQGTRGPFAGRTRPALRSASVRDWWWWLLDWFEHSRPARIGLYLAGGLVIFGFAAWLWIFPWWLKHNAVRLAQKWLDAGHLRYAAEATQQATRLDPENPEPWRIAAELARRGGQYEQARDYSRRAADLAPEAPFVQIDLAADLLLAGHTDQADRVLDGLATTVVMESPDALRLRGEIARRRGRMAAARGFFEQAVRLEGPKAVNEVPLAVILLGSAEPRDHERGVDLLSRRAADANWGPIVLRILLDDASLRANQAAMVRWADALRSHPGCTNGDIPRCLLALAKAAPDRYREVLATLERNHAATPQAAVELISWLNQIGRGADAATWMRTLPEAGLRRPPLAVAAAEALRQAGAWNDLQAWTTGSDWGADAEFLRWCYGLNAARRLGDAAKAEELLRTLLGRAEANGAHGLFAAASLYSWDLRPEAVALWWKVSDASGAHATDALGSLARHYQLARDADGQFRAFRRLYGLKPGDRNIANNYAFFAALVDRDPRPAEQLSRDNLRAEPANLNYLATAGFVLLQAGRLDEALKLLATKADVAAQSPGLGFAYGLALNRAGRTAEARKLLATVPPETLTTAEANLVRAILPDYDANAAR
jgi:tetratricopeptide (TPR) repeat protein